MAFHSQASSSRFSQMEWNLSWWPSIARHQVQGLVKWNGSNLSWWPSIARHQVQGLVKWNGSNLSWWPSIARHQVQGLVKWNGSNLSWWPSIARHQVQGLVKLNGGNLSWWPSSNGLLHLRPPSSPPPPPWFTVRLPHGECDFQVHWYIKQLFFWKPNLTSVVHKNVPQRV